MPVPALPDRVVLLASLLVWLSVVRFTAGKQD